MITGFENTMNQLYGLSVRGDLISRQAAIDALCINCDHVQAVCAHYPCEQYKNMVHAVKQLPSVQQTPEWIPCHERLPEKDGNYLIWFQYKNALGNLSESMAMEYYANSTGWDCDNVNVIAWHPLPDPYKDEKKI